MPVPVAVEQDTYVAVPLLRQHLRLDRFVGMLDTHFLLASMSFNALSDPSPASSSVSVITGGPLMSHDGPLSPAGSESTPVLRQVEFAQMDADIPIGVVPGRTAYAVGSTSSANRLELGELLTNRLSMSESWDELWDGGSE